MIDEKIQALEKQIHDLTTELHRLRKDARGAKVRNYEFATLEGTVTLRDLFAGRDRLLVIHNMGQGCRYCTLWADGINAFLPHLESALSVALLSRDPPETQRQFANARNWRFRTASHGGGDYIREQTVMDGQNNTPGAVVYEREDDEIYRKASAVFGPGDLYCSIWNLLGLAGLGDSEWTPQFRYWTRPEKLDDGSENVID